MNKTKITLNVIAEQNEKLNKMVNSSKSEQRLVFRATIILLLSYGNNERKVARELDINIKAVRKWRDRFFQKGTDYSVPYL